MKKHDDPSSMSDARLDEHVRELAEQSQARRAHLKALFREARRRGLELPPDQQALEEELEDEE